METTALKTTISYESKLVRRNWLYYLFILGILGYTVGILIPWDIHYLLWQKVALASSVLSRGVYFLNLFQSLIVIFLVCDIQRKRKKAETREVLSPRPISNGQSFLGGFLGILLPFLVVDIIYIIACVIINIVVPDSTVNLWVPLFYLLARVIPPLVFITGLSILVTRLVKLSFISWFILIGFLYFSYAFMVTPLYGVLDFRGGLLPDSFSTLVGFIHIENTLLQQGAFLLLGISFLCFAVPLAKRIPGRPGRKPYFILSATLLLAFSLFLGYLYMEKFQTRLKNRIAYREAFLEYNNYPTARVLTHDITYRPGGDKFSATSHMKIVNQRKARMDQFPLFLNPGLVVNKIESDGQTVPFHRDRQVIVIERPLSPEENIDLKIEYEGKIDEDIYQVNIPDEDYFAPVTFTSYNENYGKRSAFLSSDFTLLIPEVIWYPMAVAPVELQASKEINFTHYTLRVENPGEQTVLSQGAPTREGNSITFHNAQNLTGLSLCMGEYQRRAITIDSVTVELYTYPGNDFYMKSLDDWKVLKQPERLAKISKQCKDRIEESQLDPYPFNYLKVIETPSSFLRGSRFSDNAQPEIVFFEERFTTTSHEKPGALPKGFSKDRQIHEYLLTEGIPHGLNDINIDRVFSGHTRSVTSEKYRGMDLIYNQMLNPQISSGLHTRPNIFNSIAKKGLQGSIMEGYSNEQHIAIYLKVSHLLAYLTTITTWDSLSRTLEEFNARARFREIDFDLFINAFEQRFGKNIRPYMDEWYSSHEIPWLSIKDFSIKTTKEAQVLDFKVGNFSEAEGIVSVIRYDWNGNGRKIVENWRSFRVKPGECKRIVVHEDANGRVELNTNFAANLPKAISPDKEKSTDVLPDEGVTPLDRNQFYPPGEIIVDNEDENFHLIDSANNRLRLADLVQEEEEDYYFIGCNTKANTWGLPTLTSDGLYNPYGEHIRSAYTKKAGTGNFKAEWVANLPEAGKYEIFIYRPHIEMYHDEGICRTNYPGMKNYYSVYTPEGKKEVVLEVEKNDPFWVSLGIFTLPAGESRVVLDDRGITIEEENHGYLTQHFQLVVADAVKWIKR